MIRPPWALLAELTHACPLHCPYCSNPLRLVRKPAELGTADWTRVLDEAGELGVVQAHLSGGEPLLRPDLAEIVAAADGSGIYTQLVTSGVGLTAARLDELATAGLRSVQLSVQDATAASSDRIAGRVAFDGKRRAAETVRASGLPFGLNVVLHRLNLDRLDEIIRLAVDWGADRVELANTQFHGWALRNLGALMPTRDQLDAARATVLAWQERLGGGAPELIWVLPDWADGVAKPCMGGWGSTSITVAPDGTALPCPSASVIDGLDAPNVRDHPLRRIWEESAAFARYRGTDWMPEPCRSCPAKEADFGGCRCQAFALTGDAARTDPACRLSPDHHLVQAERPAGPLVYRKP
ncbi:pyrroloquinoline quinone biosynthesis protein PqqE [Actinomadura rupiterrae]|uniref:pyrroloquinoline quinone biosynthesis protein PqqE n=1 Tax=Actinomadura rupiterrae TaxID=559627 RepID=UPI0020A55010|nr:pyrroloquinoline quinone biosynthesis protein PqqE [Actinomadura rupiterrae]MCP2342565.1 pyrroloquinoline quinone biosynthesis protein E [Actinomadura rupiterrae]